MGVRSGSTNDVEKSRLSDAADKGEGGWGCEGARSISTNDVEGFGVCGVVVDEGEAGKY
jgi:hypothetical protein